jgi:hypothetical protein
MGDLFREPVLYCRLGLGDQHELAAPHLRQVLRHDGSDGIALGLLLQLPVNPRTLGPFENRFYAWLAVSQRPVIEVGRVM